METFKLVKLGDICKFEAKSDKLSSCGKNKGLYNFYTSSKIQKCDEADYTDECLIISTGNVNKIYIDKSFSCSAYNIVLSSQYNKYIYYLLKSNTFNLVFNKCLVFKEQTKTENQNVKLTKKEISDLIILIPENNDLIDEWVTKISIHYDNKKEKQAKIDKLKLSMKEEIKKFQENDDFLTNIKPLLTDIEVLNEEIKNIDIIYKELLEELSKLAIKNYPKKKSSPKSPTVVELKQLCKQNGIKGYSLKNKDELIELLNNNGIFP